MNGMTLLFPAQLSVYLALTASACGEEIAFLEHQLYTWLSGKRFANIRSSILHQNLRGSTLLGSRVEEVSKARF